MRDIYDKLRSYTDEERDNILLNVQFIPDNELYNMYDNYLDEANDYVSVEGLIYKPSEILKTVDPIAYKCGFDDYWNNLYEYIQIDGYYYESDEVERALDDYEYRQTEEYKAEQEVNNQIDQMRGK